ncbi:MAG: hypothetical protein ACO3NK_03840 [Prochlorotrichaceae cyanobacterium]|jgi:hypothetical protein
MKVIYTKLCLVVGHIIICNMALMAPPSLANPSITLSPTSIAGNLDLDGEGSASSHIVKVADLEFSTTNQSGCTLNVTSGRITKVNGEDIDYQITTVADGSSAPAQNDFTVSSGDNYTLVVNDTSLISRDVYILYTPGIFQDPGLYSSSVNVSVSDNP